MATPFLMITVGGMLAILGLVALAIVWPRKRPVALFAGPPKVYKPYTLVSKYKVSPNTVIFRFALPTPRHKLGLPIGKHIYLKFTDENKVPVSRAYTPISCDSDYGYFDLMIKLYSTGKMSQHLSSLNENDTIDVWGPAGALQYLGPGLVEVEKKTRPIKSIGMIAGGSGITPMLQIIRQIEKDATDKTEVRLIFANVTVDDILLHDELQHCIKQMKNFKLYLTLDKPPSGWTGGIGYVTPQMIGEHLPAPSADSLICLCGPKPMVDILRDKHLPGLGYAKESVFCF